MDECTFSMKKELGFFGSLDKQCLTIPDRLYRVSSRYGITGVIDPNPVYGEIWRENGERVENGAANTS